MYVVCTIINYNITFYYSLNMYTAIIVSRTIRTIICVYNKGWNEQEIGFEF